MTRCRAAAATQTIIHFQHCFLVCLHHLSHGGDVPSELSAVEGCALDGIQHRCAVSVGVDYPAITYLKTSSSWSSGRSVTFLT